MWVGCRKWSANAPTTNLLHSDIYRRLPYSYSCAMCGVVLSGVGRQVVLASLVRTLAGLRASSSSLVDALVGSKRDRRSSIPLSRGIAESLNKVRVGCVMYGYV